MDVTGSGSRSRRRGRGRRRRGGGGIGLRSRGGIGRLITASGDAERNHNEDQSKNQQLKAGLHREISFTKKLLTQKGGAYYAPYKIISHSAFFVNSFFKNRDVAQKPKRIFVKRRKTLMQ
jgi:hypothetical protein